jgi:signal transduction histidine kinase/ActR/RegA family two-component response regulator
MTLRRFISTAVPYGTVLLALACAVGGLRYQRTRLRQDAFVYWRNRMNASADVTRAAVQTWLDERQLDDRLLARQATKTPDLFRPGHSAGLQGKELGDVITVDAVERGYRGIWVLRADGIVVVSSVGADPLPSIVHALAMESAQNGERQTIGPLRLDNGEQLFAVIEPVVIERPGRPIDYLGAIVVGIDPYESLFPTVLREEEGEEHSRHRLVQHVGDEFVVLTPSKLPMAGPGQIRRPWALAFEAGRLAAEGTDTSGLLRGYDDTPIIAATRHIPETGWGIIRALDEDAAYAAAEREFNFDVAFVGTLFLLGLSLAFAFRRRLRINRLIRAKEDAETANAAKSEFLARMSHELRTPLNSVIGFSNVLRKNKAGNLQPQDLGYLERIGTNGVQLLALINDILDLSKIESGKLSLEITSVSVGDLVHDTLVQLGDRRFKEGVSVDALVPLALDAIDTDAAKLRQILINLIGNAVKFTHAGSVTVTVEANSQGNRPARIRVTDTGIGIARDRLSAVFDAFEQADTSTTRQFGGTGLGLSISRALCEALGFRLQVDSVLGRGTTFTIELVDGIAAPRSAPPIAAPLARSSRLDPAASADSGAPLVLVIEDDADARELLRMHIAELGYRVALAASGADGLQMAKSLFPQLITLDLMMPGMDGWELLKRLAADPALARIPVVIVSSIAGEMQHSFVGAVDWVDKPVAHEMLCDAIGRIIGHKESGVAIIESDPPTRQLLRR